MTENEKESAADRAIREALASVERIESERRDASAEEAIIDDSDGDTLDPDNVEVLAMSADAPPPRGDESGPHQAAPAGDGGPAPKKSAQEAMLESLIKAKQEANEALQQTQREAKDLFDRLTRISADFENYKKRQGREKDDAIKFGNEKAFKEFLPVLDNLQRALTAGGDATGAFVDGVRLVTKQFEDAMARLGVVGFDSVGEVFDPARHEAVSSRADATIPAQHVAEEYQRGYFLHDRLLRPALVVVSLGPEN
jgi:molecular chaperone GrpE